MADLEHVAAILDGHLPAGAGGLGNRDAGRQALSGGADRRLGARRGSSWPPQPSQQPLRSQRDRSSSKTPSSSSRSAQQRPEQQSSGNNGGSKAIPPQSPQQVSAGPYNEPGPQSTGRVWHCSACDVWVPKRDGDWEVHCCGIRHQRQLLSLKVHHQRGKLVLSAFESLPGPRDPVHRLVGRGASQFGLAQPSSSSLAAATSHSLSPQQLQAVKQLHTQALTELLNLFGVGQTYNCAGQELSVQQLAAALGACTITASVATGAEGQRDAAEGSLQVEEGQLLLSSAPAIAAAALRVKQMGFDAAGAHLQVGLEGQPFAAVAASFAALRLLLDALSASPSITHLTLSLRHSGLRAMPGYQLSQLERAWGAHVLPSMSTLLERNPAIRAIRLELPPPLAATCQHQLPSLHFTAQQASIASRQYLLMALHPRAGRCSRLQLLPLTLFREVLGLAAPLEPCSIEVMAVESGEE